MADIGRPASVPASAWRSQGQGHGKGKRGFPYSNAHDEAGERPDPRDAVRILGLNPHAYPEEVQAVLADLLGQVDHLNHELEQALRRQEWLEQQADSHPTLPVLGRRAFLRELEHFLARRAATMTALAPTDDKPPGMLAVFYLANFERLHRRFGLRAADGALAHMVTTILETVRATDLVGAVGGAGIGVLMTLAEEEGARRKTDTLRADLSARPMSLGPELVPLRVVSAVTELGTDGTTEYVLDSLDAALRTALRAAVQE